MTVMLSELIIASHNAGKVREIDALVAPLGIRVVSAAALNLPEPEETGSTFAENARLKSDAAMLATGKPALSDDSGLVIPALGGQPGICSARWAGPDKDFAVAFERIRRELSSLRGGEADAAIQHSPLAEPGGLLRSARNDEMIKAHFICMLALSLPGGVCQLFEGRVDGTLTFPPRGKKGFGYDPIFVPDGYDVTFAEMDPSEKHAISHRARAFEKFVEWLKAAN